MCKFKLLTSNIRDFVHKSKSLRGFLNWVVLCVCSFLLFALSATVAEPVMDLIKVMFHPEKTHSPVEWIGFYLGAFIATNVVLFFVISALYTKNNLLEMVKEEDPLSLRERGRGEGVAEATELHIETKAIKRKVKRFRSCGASYFSLLVQRKVTKTKHTLPSRPAR